MACLCETSQHCPGLTKARPDICIKETKTSTAAQDTDKQTPPSENMDVYKLSCAGLTFPESGPLDDFSRQLGTLHNQENFPDATVINYSHLKPYLTGTDVTQLPSASFHVVVFSLLLSYFPSPQQRWQCCMKAHKLLAVNGLLFIITPDSSHQNRNAPMMKSWKHAVESIGFVRWRYVKETHLHCMAFCKVAPCHLSSHSDNVRPEMLYIPQDYQEDEEESVFANVPRSEEEDLEMSQVFSELPDIDD